MQRRATTARNASGGEPSERKIKVGRRDSSEREREKMKYDAMVGRPGGSVVAALPHAYSNMAQLVDPDAAVDDNGPEVRRPWHRGKAVPELSDGR